MRNNNQSDKIIAYDTAVKMLKNKNSPVCLGIEQELKSLDKPKTSSSSSSVKIDAGGKIQSEEMTRD